MARTGSKKPKLTKEEINELKKRNAFSKQISDIFSFSGFESIPVRGWHFELGGRDNELDNVFIYENLLIICEDTIRFIKEKEKAAKQNISFNRNHKLEKEETAEIITSKYKKEFFDLLKAKADQNTYLKRFTYREFKVYFLYFEYGIQRYTEHDEVRYPHLTLIDKPTLNYFSLMSKSIKSSFKYEIFKFLDLHIKDIGEPDPAGNRDIKTIDAPIIYPEKSTGYQDEVRMVSFMMRPKDLVRYSYVLRKDGWDQKTELYQRLIMPKRIQSIRDFVRKKKTTFLNNIIVTLPSNVKFYDSKYNEIKIQDITNFEKDISIQIPLDYNSIGIIDGQHRVYAFYEDCDPNSESEISIKPLRETLSLLVTGIIYPNKGKYDDEAERRKFESNLFVTINKNAKAVDADTLIQVQAIMNPTSGEAISRKVIELLNKAEPFENMFQLSKTENAPIKTASVIKYALSSLLVAENKSSSLYKYWLSKEEKAEDFKLQGSNSEEIKKYVNYCSNCLKTYFTAVKSRFFGFWNGESKLLKVISINAFVIAFRETIETMNGPQSYEFYQNAFSRLELDFSKDGRFPYAGAQYSMFAKKTIIPVIIKAYQEKK